MLASRIFLLTSAIPVPENHATALSDININVINAYFEYLLEINSSEKVRPFLHNYPFTAENIQIVIYFRNPDRSKVASGQINVASAREGKISYYIDYPEKHTLKAICEETYEEALKMVSSQ